MRVLQFFFLPLFLLAACGRSELLPTYDLSGNTMGTTFTVTIVSPPTAVDLDGLKTEIYDTLEHVNAIASTYLDDSELSEFNADTSTDWISVSTEFCDMVASALDISAVTNGAFDITVGPLVNLWGFGASTHNTSLPADEDIRSARAGVGYEMLQADCKQPALRKSSGAIYVDLSGWAKGHAVDGIANLLDEHQLDNYLVEIGGELRLKGHNAEQKRFSIAIEKPLLNNDINYILVPLSDVAVATSGNYRNFFEQDGQRYAHTIDPRTGYPVKHKLSGVTVVSTSTAYADAVATALMVLGPDDGYALAEQLGIASLFIVRSDEGMKEISTPQFEQLRRL